jgi:hypothetical protein
MMLYDLWMSREREYSLANKVLGYCFLSVGVLGGSYFLFQSLIPLLGYTESGAAICTILAFIGGVLLFMTRKKKSSSPEGLSQQTLSTLKNLDVEKILKEHALSLPLISFGVGIILSQLNNPRKLLDLYKTLVR